MVNEKHFEMSSNDALIHDRERINRLKSTLQGRINLLNVFQGMIDKNHEPITAKKLKIDINNEYQIINFLIKNTDEIDYLLENVKEWIDKNGSKWQKNRILKDFK